MCPGRKHLYGEQDAQDQDDLNIDPVERSGILYPEGQDGDAHGQEDIDHRSGNKHRNNKRQVARMKAGKTSDTEISDQQTGSKVQEKLQCDLRKIPCDHIKDIMVRFVDHISDGAAFNIIADLACNCIISGSEPYDLCQYHIPDGLIHRITVNQLPGIGVDILPKVQEYKENDKEDHEAHKDIHDILQALHQGGLKNKEILSHRLLVPPFFIDLRNDVFQGDIGDINVDDVIGINQLHSIADVFLRDIHL